ncbi:tetratricopeptide repeat protein [Rhodoplanes azumiensis]|uniref:Tetratricopeptide repeat protein n=1 Tax=Rhodoplanes azumiensis TaxID=1897628 RepID=A0ABW5AMZ1_9BRAD
MQKLAVLFIALVITATPTEARRGSVDGGCTSDDPDVQIASCTRIIERGSRETMLTRAIAFTSRCLAYSKKRMYDRAIADSEEAVRLQPTFAPGFTCRGTARAEKGEHERAVRDFDEAIRLDPKSVWAYNGRATSHLQMRNYDRAIADFGEAFRLNPGYPGHVYNRGNAYLAKGETDLALRDYDIAIGLNPKSSWFWSARGNAFVLKGDIERAIEHYDSAIRLDPKYVAGYYYRGRAYVKKGEPERAVRDYDEGLRIAPTSALMLAGRGAAHVERKDYESAIKDFDEAISLDSSLGDAYVGKVSVLILQNKAAQALSVIEGVVLRHPDSSQLQNALAWTLFKLGRDREGLPAVERAIMLDPTNAAALDTRANIREAMGDLEGALDDFRAALAIHFIAESQAGAERVAALLARQKQATMVVERPSPPSPSPGPVSAIAERGPRVALVIGNGDYAAVTTLPNPQNDARDMAGALRDLGFKVIEGYDLDGTAMRRRIGEFGAALPGARVSLFYYAGHGLQVAGKNYLLPVDAKLERPSSLGVEAVEIGTVLADMEAEKRVNLVFLDACRDNPLSRSLARSLGTRSGSVSQGLAQLNAGIGTLIAFATSPDTVALDGDGRNSPFTAALLKHIRTPALEIRSMLTRVRADVIRATGDRQVPWDHSSLTGEFFLRAER